MRGIIEWIAGSPKADGFLNWCWNAIAVAVVIGGVAMIILQIMLAIGGKNGTLH